MNPLFNIGTIYMTCGVNETMTQNVPFAFFISASLNRHIKGDWGDVCKNDKAENQFSLNKSLRLFSAYEKEGLPKIWIITEADRSETTILFPDEY